MAEPSPARWEAILRHLLIIALYICSIAAPLPAAGTIGLGDTLEDTYVLTGLDGRAMRLADFPSPKGRVLIFFSIVCPTSRIYAHHLKRIHAEYESRGIKLIAVNANVNETPENIAAFVGKDQLEFTILRDINNRLADLLEARSTPHAFLFNSQGVLQYHGEIDNGFGVAEETTSQGLWEAMDALLAGEPVPRAETPAFGCIIRRVHTPPTDISPDAPTFTRDILPFLQRNCQTCHHEGGIGRVAYNDYDLVAAWVPDMRDSIRAGNMPPWPARSDINDFAGSRALSDADRQLFERWIDEGMPKGDPSDAPEPLDFPNEWTMGTPDLVLIPEVPYTVEAVGQDEYRCFVIPLDLKEDVYVRGIEILPDAKEVVHHVAIYLDVTGKAIELENADPRPGYESFGGIGFETSGFLGGWAPGNSPLLLPEGIGRPLPKKCHIVIQMHYHKSGRVVQDQSKLGVYLHKKPVKQVLAEEAVASRLLFIPAGVPRFEVSGGITIDQDSHVHAILPHMHLIGKEIKITATFPDGSVKPLIWIDEWEFAWQETYAYKEPIALPRGTRVNLDAVYDNSADNPNNPNSPPKFVRWGEESSDEMCIAFLFVTRDNENLLEK